MENCKRQRAGFCTCKGPHFCVLGWAHSHWEQGQEPGECPRFHVLDTEPTTLALGMGVLLSPPAGAPNP